MKIMVVMRKIQPHFMNMKLKRIEEKTLEQ